MKSQKQLLFRDILKNDMISLFDDVILSMKVDALIDINKFEQLYLYPNEEKQLDDSLLMLTDISKMRLEDKTPAIKGDKFVNEIMDYLGKYKVCKTANINHNADIRVQDIILVEVKCYNNTVPSKEVDKFHKDIDIRDVKAGLFISTHNISGIRLFDLRYHQKGFEKIPVIFIVVERDALSIVEVCIELLLSIINNNEYREYYINESHVNMIRGYIENINLVKYDLNMMHRNMTSHIMNISNSLTLIENNLRNTVNHIINENNTKKMLINDKISITNLSKYDINSKYKISDMILFNELIEYIESKSNINSWNLYKTFITTTINYNDSKVDIGIEFYAKKLVFYISMKFIDPSILSSLMFLNNLKIEDNYCYIHINSHSMEIIKSILLPLNTNN